MNQFIAAPELGEFGIALAVVVLLTNTVVRVTAAWPRVAEYRLLIALFVAQVVVFAGHGAPGDVSGWFVTILNGLILFGAALASNQLIASAVAGAVEQRMRNGNTVRRDDSPRFWEPWVKGK